MSPARDPVTPPAALETLQRDVAAVVSRLQADLEALARRPGDPAALLRMSEVLSYQADVLAGRLALAERAATDFAPRADGLADGFCAVRSDVATLAQLGRRMAEAAHGRFRPGAYAPV